MRRRAARAAVVVALLTALSRVAGFGRTFAFGRAVGSGCVGDVYTTANTVPNVVFDIVAGGMLSALVVPLLAPALHRDDRERVDAVVSALLTWVLVILVPLGVVLAVCAEPIVSVLLRSTAGCPQSEALGARMLVVFAPQVVLYGVGVVLSGVLTAAQRFTWPALAPLLSSVVVVVAYVVYGRLATTTVAIARLPGNAEYVLSAGTTAGVVVLTLCLVPVVRRLGVRYRPRLRFPEGVAATVVRTAGWGAATLAASETSTLVMIALANGHSPQGTLVILTAAQTIYLLPWAVLSLPIATTTFPRLAADWQAGASDAVRRRLNATATTIVTVSAGGTALLVAVARPAAHGPFGAQASALSQFAPAVAGFAVGLVGWSLVALLARALYAVEQVRVAAVAQVAGQAVVIVADVVLTEALPADHRALALASGNSVGVLVAAALLLRAAHRAGVLSFDDVWWRRCASCAGAAVLAGLAGWSIGRHTSSAFFSAALDAVVASAGTAVVYLAVLAVLDRSAVRQVVSLVRPTADVP